MNVSTKDLRMQPGKILEKVARGIEIIITYRGKKVARIVPIDNDKDTVKSHEMFGMWKDREFTESVEEEIRNLRKGRSF